MHAIMEPDQRDLCCDKNKIQDDRAYNVEDDVRYDFRKSHSVEALFDN